MRAYKQISPQDTFVTTYVSHKQWEISGSEYSNYGISYAEIDRYDENTYYLDESDKFNGSYKPLIFKSLNHLYYRSFNTTGSLDSEIGIVSSSYEHYLQTSLIEPNIRHIDNKILLISIPRHIVGTGIRPGEFRMELPEGITNDLYVDFGYLLVGYFAEFLNGLNIDSDAVFDSTEGTLVVKTIYGDYIRVGDVNYLHGIITITHPGLIEAYLTKDIKPALSFRSTKEIHSLNTHCTVLAEELNSTLNPTVKVSGSLGKIKPDFLIPEFTPYITTVGLYNSSNELIAVGKMSQPVPKSDQTDMVFVVKVSIDNIYNGTHPRALSVQDNDYIDDTYVGDYFI